MGFGFLFLVNQVAVFFLLIASLYLGSSDDAQQGLSQEIREDFNFEIILAVGSREAFVSESLPQIAQARYSSEPAYWTWRPVVEYSSSSTPSCGRLLHRLMPHL